MLDLLTNPSLWLILLIFSILGALARLTNYYAGLKGKDTIISLYPRITLETWESVLLWYKHLGHLPLLISSIPIIGSLLTVGAGMSGISRNAFLFWVAISKIIRNWILLFIFWKLL